jgi:hypothetical protein
MLIWALRARGAALDGDAERVANDIEQAQIIRRRFAPVGAGNVGTLTTPLRGMLAW